MLPQQRLELLAVPFVEVECIPWPAGDKRRRRRTVRRGDQEPPLGAQQPAGGLQESLRLRQVLEVLEIGDQVEGTGQAIQLVAVAHLELDAVASELLDGPLDRPGIEVDSRHRRRPGRPQDPRP